MNFNENDLWREKTELLYLRILKLARAKVLLKLEFDTEDQVLSLFLLILRMVWMLLQGAKVSRLDSQYLLCQFSLNQQISTIIIVIAIIWHNNDTDLRPIS